MSNQRKRYHIDGFHIIDTENPQAKPIYIRDFLDIGSHEYQKSKLTASEKLNIITELGKKHLTKVWAGHSTNTDKPDKARKDVIFATIFLRKIVNPPNFEFCSLHYLNQWIIKDSKYCEGLRNGNEDKKLTTLQDAAGFYKVARNLHTTESFKPTESHKRYQSVLECIDSLRSSDFSSCPTTKVMEIERQISDQYGDGKRSVLSLTTKLLWLKVKEPIVIYDSQARNALEIEPGELDGKYPEYYDAWQRAFKHHKTKIADVCAKLPELHLYAANRTPKAEIEAVANQNWFHERVFDIYLWNKGNR
ncbi:MAG: hypothetical protein PHU06_12745 [Gallionella sp.]|nr:hypothetical protein [Gallionella sp.]MDD4959506.1 hypothetical protein [Gallionella sp.]